MSAILAYQVTGFAYQGDGLFAYQGSSDGAPALVSQEEPISNWQAHHRRIWKVRTKRELEELLLAERLALGILAPEPQVIEAIVAKAALPDKPTRAATRAPALRPQDVHSDVYREFLAAEMAFEEFKLEVAARRRRLHAAAMLMLAH